MSFRQLAPTDGCLTPALSASLESLDEAIRVEDWEEASRQLREALKHLLIFSTCTVAGMVQELEQSRPEIQALAQSIDSLASYERLLRFSLSVLRTLDHPIKDIVLHIFFPKEVGLALPPQGRWLMGGPSSDTPPLLSACSEMLIPIVAPARLWTDGSLERASQLETYLPILNSWLQDSHALMTLFEFETEVSDQGLVIAGLSSADFRFALLPKIEWQPALPLNARPRSPIPLALPLSLAEEQPLASDSGQVVNLAMPPSPFSPPDPEDVPNSEVLGPGSSRSNWSPAELERQLTRPLRFDQCPREVVSRILSFCREQRSGYIILEGPVGAGKTLVASSLALEGSGGAAGLATLVFPVHQALRSDFQTFVEIFDERLQDRGALADRHALTLSAAASGSGQLRPLGHRVTRELNIRYPSHLGSERFFAYLSGLLLLNGTRILIVLDGLDEVFEGAESQVFLSDFLPPKLPDGAFVVLTCQLQACGSRAIQKLTTLERNGALRIQLDPTRPEYLKLATRLLGEEPPPSSRGQTLSLVEHRHALARSGLLSAALVSSTAELLPLAFEALERKRGLEPLELVLALATIPGRLHIAEMSPLGLPAHALQAVIEDWPSLLRFFKEENGQSIQLAHEELRHYLLENHAQAYCACCKRLAQRASYYLTHEHAGEVHEFRGQAHSNFELRRRLLTRLHAWLLDSQDTDLIKQIFSLEALRRLRQTLCNQLESQGRFHHKLSILAGYRQGLSLLTARYPNDELNEELAWAHNSRGLTYFRLGQFSRSLDEIAEAIRIFRYLVEERAREDYRGGLASAQNRQSEALLYLGDYEPALASANQAVDGYRQVVEERGQIEQSHLLARALAHRARVHVVLAQAEAAGADYDQAIALYAQTSSSDGDPRQIQSYAEALVCRAEQGLYRGNLRLARQDLSRAREQLARLQSGGTTAALSNDFDARLMEVRALELQAQVGRTEGAHHEAVSHCDEALSIVQQMLDDGRLDVRERSSQLLALRGQLWGALGEIEKASTDWTHSLAHLSRLIEFEGHPGLRPHRAKVYLLRAQYLRDTGREAEAVQDFERAVEDLSSVAQGDQPLDRRSLFELSQAHHQLGLLFQNMGDEKRAIQSFTHVIAYLHRESDWLADECLAYRLRSQSYRRLGNLDLALADAHTAVEKLAPALEHHPELRAELALAHHQRGQLQELQGEKKAALRDFTLGIHLLTQEVTESGPALARLSLARAQLYFELEQPGAALGDLEEAVSLLKNGAGLAPAERDALLLADYTLMSRILLAQDQPREALDCQEKALNLLQMSGEVSGEGWAARKSAHPAGELVKLSRDRCSTLATLGRYLEAADQLIALVEVNLGEASGASDQAIFRSLCQQLRSETHRLLQDSTEHEPGRRMRAVELLQKELQLRLLMGRTLEGQLPLVEAFNLTGWLLGELNHMAEALEAYEQACALSDPRSSEGLDPALLTALFGHRIWAFKQRGLLLESMHQTESALVIYDQALDWLEAANRRNKSDHALASQDHFSWILLRQSVLFARQHRDFEATTALSRSIEIDRMLLGHNNQASGVRLAQALLLRARSQDDKAGLSQKISDINEALALLQQQDPLEVSPLVDSGLSRQGSSSSIEQDVLYCRWTLLLHQPTVETLVYCLGRLESWRDPVLPLWPGGPPPARLLVTCLQALVILDRQAKPELKRALTLIKKRAPDRLQDLPASPELFLKLAALADSESDLELLALASRQSWLETKIHGSPAYPRLVFCLNRLGVRLSQIAPSEPAALDPSQAHWAHVNQALQGLGHFIDNSETNPAWQVDLNNLAKTWQSLPITLTQKLAINRPLLQSLRRW